MDRKTSWTSHRQIRNLIARFLCLYNQRSNMSETFLHSFYVIFQSVHQPYFCNCSHCYQTVENFLRRQSVRVCSSHVVVWFLLVMQCAQHQDLSEKWRQANSELLEARLWAVNDFVIDNREEAILQCRIRAMWFRSKIFEPGIWTRFTSEAVCHCRARVARRSRDHRPTVKQRFLVDVSSN